MIGADIVSLFASLGDPGMILALVAIIAFDGIVFPIVPEVWMVFIFGTDPSIGWALAIILAAGVGSLVANFTLYYLVKAAKLPQRIKDVMTKYTDFLVVHDERLLLLNRLAPVVPYTGAFMAVNKWDLRKCAVYIFIGSVAKAAVVVALAWLSYENLRAELAPWVAIIAVAVVLVVSIIASYIYKRRVGLRGETPRSQ